MQEQVNRMAGWRGKNAKSGASKKSAATPQQTRSGSVSDTHVDVSTTPKSKKASWKKGGAAVATGSGKYWASGKGSAALLPSNFAKLFTMLVLLGGCVLMFVIYLLRQDARVQLASIVAYDYSHPLAPNGWALEDQQLFNEVLADQDTLTPIARTEKVNGKWEELLIDTLHKLKRGGPGGGLIFSRYGTAILHLSAHGVLNGSGVPCLLFSDSSPSDDQTWVPLQTIMTMVGKHATEAKLRMLIVIDTGKQPEDQRMGILQNGFIEEAVPIIEALRFPNLAVQFSTSPNQIAWTAPELGGSVYGVALVKGLSGLADKNRNGRITVIELTDYVADQTTNYVWNTREQPQRPRLVWSDGGTAKDFELVYAANSKPWIPNTLNNVTMLKQTEDAWRSFDARRPSIASEHPWQVAKILSHLTRATQMAMAGKAYQDGMRSELGDANTTLNSIIPNRPNVRLGGVSLPYLIRTGAFKPEIDEKQRVEYVPANEQASAATIDQTNAKDPSPNDGSKPQIAPSSSNKSTIVDRIGKPPQPGPDGKYLFDEAAREWLFRPTTQEGTAIDLPVASSRYARVNVGLQWMLEENTKFTRENLANVIKLIDPAFKSQEVCHEECLLQNIASHLETTRNWPLRQETPSRIWHGLMLVVRQCDEALAILDDRVSFTLSQRAGKLENELHLVTDQIFSADTPDKINNVTVSLKQLMTQAQELLRDRDQLEEAWRLSDRLADALPLLFDWEVFQSTEQSESNTLEQIGALKSLLGHYNSLRRTLQSGSVPSRSDLDEPAGLLSRQIDGYASELTELTAQGTVDQAATFGRLLRLLSLRPVELNAEKIVKSQQDVEDRLITMNRRAQDTDVFASLFEQSVKNPIDLTNRVTSDDVWYRRIDLHAAIMDASSDFSKTPTKIAVPTSEGKTVRGFAAIYGKVLRQFCNETVQEVLRLQQECISGLQAIDPALLVETREQLFETAKASRLQSNSILPDTLGASISPAQTAIKLSRQNNFLWQASRLQSDFWATPKEPRLNARPYFEAAANDWINAAQRVASDIAGPVESASRELQRHVSLAAAWPQNLQSLKATTTEPIAVKGEWKADQYPFGQAALNVAINGNLKTIAKLRSASTEQINLPMPVGTRARPSEKIDMIAEELPVGQHLLVAAFRGHTADLPLQLDAIDPPLRLAWRLYEPNEASVRIFAKPTPARIVFVLDCSRSIDKEDLEKAKTALTEAIHDIANERTEVAVVVFGHSIDYPDRSDKDLVQQAKWQEYHPSDRKPCNDVETILPLTRTADNDGQINTGLFTALDRDFSLLLPHGRTPLFLAVINAAKLLSADPQYAGAKRIVVLTDGNDDVKATSGGKPLSSGVFAVPPEFDKSQADVQSAVANISNFQLHIIGFKFNKQQISSENLKSLAERTGGRFYDSSSADELGGKLQESLQTKRFILVDLQSNARLGIQVLGRTLKVPGKLLPGNFRVEIEGTNDRLPLLLKGGEALEASYERGPIFQFSGIERTWKINGGSRADAQMESAEVNVDASWLSMQDTSEALVRVSLENRDMSNQTLRPENVLLEIRSENAGTDKPIVWTSDVQWEDIRRAPVVRVPIDSLKLRGQVIQSRLWLRRESTPPDFSQAFNLRQLALKPELESGIKLSATEQSQNGNLRITVTETRTPTTPLLHWAIQPSPDVELVHEFYSNRVEHHYTYSNSIVRDQLRFLPTEMPPTTNGEWSASDWMKALVR